MPLDAIIKINSVVTPSNYYLPWQKKTSKPTSGSGFLLESEFGKSLITNAHVVADATYISIRRCRSAESYEAQVKAISHESDLALLEVKDERFWKETNDVKALKLGRLPQLQDHVNVVGFPTGGDGISVTRGVVSRIEPIQYAHGGIHLLGVQIDASINPGNSGGPALIESEGIQKNEVVGVAFQSLSGADNIGYIIPPPVINHFLTQYHLHKKYTGFPQLGVQLQHLENESLRKFYQLAEDTTGILVTHISDVSPAVNSLAVNDVILSVEGIQIANNGTVEFEGGERLFLNYLLVNKFVGDTCKMDVLRAGQRISVSFPLASSSSLQLVPLKNLPSYLVYGGLVFTKLSIPYLREFEHEDQENWFDVAPRNLVQRALTGFKESEDHEITILSHVLADDINYGFTHLYNMELEKFNGKKVKNLKHLQELIEDSGEEFARFDFLDKSVVILEVRQVKERGSRILRQYAIPSAYSQDLRAPKTK
uniref:PDZ domain-containing protein n=1 Tax=Arcella intermedia TaxID=1963864 RepID=A0A6B2L325_9EUKA